MNDVEIEFLRRLLAIGGGGDSLEIGTPSKGGAVKVYGDFSKPDEFLQKIENAKRVRERAQELLGAKE